MVRMNILCCFVYITSVTEFVFTGYLHSAYRANYLFKTSTVYCKTKTASGKSLELEQPQYFVDGRGTNNNGTNLY